MVFGAGGPDKKRAVRRVGSPGGQGAEGRLGLPPPSIGPFSSKGKAPASAEVKKWRKPLGGFIPLLTITVNILALNFHASNP